MTISLNSELEQIVNEAMHSGHYQTPEQVLTEALTLWQKQHATPATPSEQEVAAKSLVELFAPLRGLDLDFGRNPSGGRPVEL